MTRADTLQVAAGLLGDAVGKLGQARACFGVVDLPGSQAEAERLVREVSELELATSQAAETARAAEPPVVRIVPPDAPGRMYGEGYDGSWFDERTEADKRAVFDREHRNNNDQNNAGDGGKGQG
ncbi:hypothetical protein [Myceligenerans pegani]|uniref:Uncharacterized protein n=1 Tax=Myceligenerans pegani TaxID=2776917 RepID=A0ABR9N2H5_9MICO|nr:hypothetical protein [Myceligenerans sp. TRM 65318]MBE1877848.1 hypothetical protein [Myceligenerans sp. TRM 65318]MBE3020119.1 hypothetical protein [Myceligenerans sp. TRM 65318]